MARRAREEAVGARRAARDDTGLYRAMTTKQEQSTRGMLRKFFRTKAEGRRVAAYIAETLPASAAIVFLLVISRRCTVTYAQRQRLHRR